MKSGCVVYLMSLRGLKSGDAMYSVTVMSSPYSAADLQHHHTAQQHHHTAQQTRGSAQHHCVSAQTRGSGSNHHTAQQHHHTAQ